MDTIYIGDKRQVFWDDYLIDSKNTSAFLRLNKPEKKECCFEFNQQNETLSISYPCILKDEYGYKMYYQPWYDDLKPYVCVIESKDGINWHRPKLNIFNFPDLKENNVVMDNVKDGIFVFYDTNPSCPENEKYKAIGSADITNSDGEIKTYLCCYISKDGYHFTFSHPMTNYGAFDSLNTAMWDGEKYICYYRSFHNLPGVDNSEILDITQIRKFKVWIVGTRDVRVSYSDDFKNWSLPELIKFDDEYDYPLYTNNVQLYDRSDIFIGFPVRYIERTKIDENVEQMASIEIKKAAAERIEKRVGHASTDCIFMCSRDGKNWHRFNNAFLTPGYENMHNWMYGDCYLSYNLLDSGKEYYNLYTIDRKFSFGYSRPLTRYEIRKDGFACYSSDGEEKEIVTKPVVFKGSTLHLNFETSAYGYIYVSILDENGSTISNGESVEIFGNNIDRKVIFKDVNISDFSEKPIILKFRMRDAKLYSMKFD